MWHYAKNQQQLGPVSEEELTGLLRSGALGDHDLVWRDGMSEWRAAGEVAELQQARFAAQSAAGEASVPAQAIQPTMLAPTTNGMAIASLVLGLASFVIGGVFTAIPAVICGHMARRQIKESPTFVQGAGMATAGLITGYIVIALTGVAILALVGVLIFSS